MGNGGWGRSEIDPKAPFDVDDLVGRPHQAEERQDRPARGLVGRPRPPGRHVQRTQLFGTEAGLRLPPVQIYQQTPTGYTTETSSLLPTSG